MYELYEMWIIYQKTFFFNWTASSIKADHITTLSQMIENNDCIFYEDYIINWYIKNKLNNIYLTYIDYE